MIYFDNAATTYPKPPEVIAEVARIMTEIGANAGRSGHKKAQQASEILFDARETVADFFNISDVERVAFTYNTTYALNMLIKGVARRGEHFVIGQMEHNSVLRCVNHLSEQGFISFSIAPADRDGIVTEKAVRALMRPNTRCVCINHVSNVCGSISDIESIAKTVHSNNALLLVDSAQSAGIVPIDVEKMGIDLLAFAGHKGLLGPQGTGGIYITPKTELKTLIEGGTGSLSQSAFQPDFMPDRFESGTLNVAGIGGLKKGIEFVKNYGIENVLSHERILTELMLGGLMSIKKVKVYGTTDLTKRTGVVAFSVAGRDCFEVAQLLDEEYGIALRSGLHCSPLAHQSLGTYDTGLVRASLGIYNTPDEVDKFLYAVSKL